MGKVLTGAVVADAAEGGRGWRGTKAHRQAEAARLSERIPLGRPDASLCGILGRLLCLCDGHLKALSQREPD